MMLRHTCWERVLAVAVFLVGTHGYVPVAKNMKSFSSVIKEGTIQATVEKVLYERNTGQPGVITEQWCAGKYEAPSNAIKTMMISFGS